ncbi:TlpA family protein disulfide reductase [Pedobacter africanus]|uniref:Thioredoxin-like n=1 Tax=Pedobacter africanus TaxID=151894 RepID=A0A1W2DI29_9SPHI|nr:TlpA disulfide reductase family protein [Pedobacter africanus]SMC97064.1 Thioredoxin-like [Pedobacter africanus]
MTTARLIYLIAIPIFCNFTLMAQKENDKQPTFIIKTSKGTEIPDSVKVLYLNQNVSFLAKQASMFAQKIGNDFEIKLPIKDPLTRFSLQFFYKGNITSSNIYYTEPTDRLTITFYKPEGEKAQFSFLGKGSEKFVLRDLLDLELRKLYSKIGKFRKTNLSKKLALNQASKAEIVEYMDTVYSYISRNNTVSEHLLKSFRGKIDNKVLDFFKYEFVAGNGISLLTEPYFIVETAQSKKYVSDYYFSKRIDSLEHCYENHPLVKYSSLYVFNRSVNLFREQFMRNDGQDFSFKDRYMALKEIKSVDLRDRLIAEFFLTPVRLQNHIKDFGERDSCLKDALLLIKEPLLIVALRKELLFSPGSRVYEFSFQDSTGNYITLKDLKGKVFVIKFYGTGCAGCAEFCSQFNSDILPEFEKDSDFKVLSVSIDLSKKIWYNTIKSGRYTGKDDIHLTAGNESAHNPMFKYYNVNSIPFILLVDKNGKLIMKINNGMSSASIRKEIKIALGKSRLIENSK